MKATPLHIVRPFYRHPAGNLSGFTLVELLVVIAIIGVLAALLLPVLSAARKKSLQTKCLSNLHQLSVAAAAYLGDTGRPMARENPAYPGARWLGTMTNYIKSNDLLLCPAAPFRKPAPPPNGQGNADTAWVKWTSDTRVMFSGSYGFNTWLYDTQPQRKDFQLFLSREDAVQTPAQTPVFADANWLDGSPLEENNPAQDLYAGRSLNANNNDMGRFTIVRHGGLNPANAPRHITSSQGLVGAVQMSLFDGHTELARLDKLWTYTWHRDWQTPASIPPPYW